jgi:hypothetical protein
MSPLQTTSVDIAHADYNHTGKFSGIKYLACYSSRHFPSTSQQHTKAGKTLQVLEQDSLPYHCLKNQITYPLSKSTYSTSTDTCSTTHPSLRRPLQHSNEPTTPVSKDSKSHQIPRLETYYSTSEDTCFILLSSLPQPFIYSKGLSCYPSRVAV